MNRSRLDELHRRFTAPFTISDAARVLSLSPESAQKTLGHLASRGWLTRVRHGLYSTVPLGAVSPSDWRGDPWVVAATCFAPCYIGGWTACNHWALTEQLFRDVVVITERKLRRGTVVIQQTHFRVKSIAERKHFGTTFVWRENTRVEISDASRTMVDVLDDPSIGGGIRHISEVVAAYFSSEHRRDATLLDYAHRAGNRTVFKRLGYIAEALELGTPKIIAESLSAISRGISLLDPSMPATGPIITKWNLRVNGSVRKLDAT